jgi:signal transduction histidine kinase
MWFFVGYLGLLTLLTIAPLAFAYWVYQHGRGRATPAFIGVLLIGAVWGFGVAVQFTLSTLPAKRTAFLLWISVTWLLAPVWFVFTIYYTGRHHWLTRPVKVALVGFSALLVGITLTNGIHHLFWRDFRLAVDPVPVLVVERTTLYYAFLLADYALVVVGLLLLVRLFLTSSHVTGGQAGALVVGALVPLVINGLHNVTPVAAIEYDPTPFSVAVFLVIMGWSLFRHQLFAIEPLARDTVLEHVGDGVVVVDTDRLLVDYNAAATALFPAIEDGFGQRLEECADSLVADASARGVEQFVSAATATTGDDRRSLSVSASPLTVADEVRAYALIFRDVTELERYADDLERKTEQLERVLNTVSHDLRNPLSVAAGNLELAAETGDDEAFRKARTALGRMDEIIEDILSLARTGQQVEEWDELPLAGVAEAAWETTRDGGQFELDAELDGQTVYADSTRLRTLFENLFRNAIDHAGDDVTVWVRAIPSGFAIEDDGPGIPPDERERVFEYGFSTDEEGTGIGLSTVEAVASAHGWSVDVTQGQNGGARFELTDVTFDGPAE